MASLVVNSIIKFSIIATALLIRENFAGGSCYPYCPERYEIDEPPKTLPNSKWSNDTICKNFEITLAPTGTFPIRPAVGFPGTGSGWILDLITAASGYYSGVIKSDYLEVQRIHNSLTPVLKWENSRVQKRFWHLTDPASGRTLLQSSYYNGFKLMKNHGRKSFDFSKKLFNKKYGGVLFVRNPWDAFISFKRSTDKAVAALDGRSLLERAEFASEAMKFAHGWANLVKTWTTNSAPNDLIVVQYEKLVENSRPELIRIMEFLNIPISQQRLGCLEKYPLIDRKREPLTKKQADYVGSLFSSMNEVNKFLHQSINDINTKLGRFQGTILNYKGPTVFQVERPDVPDEL